MVHAQPVRVPPLRGPRLVQIRQIQAQRGMWRPAGQGGRTTAAPDRDPIALALELTIQESLEPREPVQAVVANRGHHSITTGIPEESMPRTPLLAELSSGVRHDAHGAHRI